MTLHLNGHMQIPRPAQQFWMVWSNIGLGTYILSEPQHSQPQEVLMLGVPTHTQRKSAPGPAPSGLLLPGQAEAGPAAHAWAPLPEFLIWGRGRAPGDSAFLTCFQVTLLPLAHGPHSGALS